VKIRGYRVETSEVEMSLQDIAFVKEAIVSAHKDQKDDTCLVAYVVLRQHEADVEKKLRKFLKDKLPDYMIPSVFVFLEALPLTPNGKVDRKALPEPDMSQRVSDEAFVSPQTPVEEIISSIWSEVLDIERIGIHDNFFDLGGHSLLMTQVVSRLNKTFNITIPLRSFFEAPTISGLSSLIQDIGWQIQGKELMKNKSDEYTWGEL
jgi:acyl carrier protein